MDSRVLGRGAAAKKSPRGDDVGVGEVVGQTLEAFMGVPQVSEAERAELRKQVELEEKRRLRDDLSDDEEGEVEVIKIVFPSGDFGVTLNILLVLYRT